jgi:WD40 repeat protein
MPFQCRNCGKKVLDDDTAEALSFRCPARVSGQKCGGELAPIEGEAAPPASPLDGLDLQQLPYPVALTAERLVNALAAGEDPLPTLFRLKDCFEVTVKFLGAVLLADYRSSPAATEEHNEALVRGLLRPTLGVWVNQLLGDLSRWLASPSPAGQPAVSSPGARVAALFFPGRKGGKPQPSELWKHCEEFVDYRNDALGHGAMRSNSVFRKDLDDWLPRLRQLLDGVTRLAPWQLCLVTGPDRCQPWMGPRPGAAEEAGAFAAEQVGHFVLCPGGDPNAVADARPRDLAPVLHYLPDPRRVPRLHFYDSVYRYQETRKEATVLEYDESIRHHSPRPIDDLERVFGQPLLAAAFKKHRGRMEIIEGQVAGFGELIEEHARIVGRDFAVRRVQRFLQERDRGLLVIEGRPGQGKTALMAHLIDQVFGHYSPEPVHFFYRRTAGITDPAVCVRSLYQSLLRAHDITEAEESRQQNTPEEVYVKLTNLISQQIGARLSPSRPQLLFIDALDEADRPPGSRNAFERIPDNLPAGVYVIVSTRPVEDRTALAQRRHLEWLDLDDPEFATANLEDGRQFVRQELTGLAVAGQTVEEISRVGAGNFLVLKLLCRHLRSALPPEEVSVFLRRLATDRQNQLGLIYEEFWRRLAPADDPRPLKLLCDVAGALVAACAPLSREILCDLLGLSAGEWDFALRRLVEYLAVLQPESPRTAEDGYRVRATFYRIYHESFADFLRDKVGPDLARLRRLFADYCWNWRQFPEGYAATYALRFAPTHLAAAGDWGRLGELLGDLGFLSAKASAGLVLDLVGDFARAGAEFPPDGPGRRRLRLLEEALRADLHFVARHPEALYQCLYNTCCWLDTAEAAGHYPAAAEGPWRAPELAPLFEQPPRTAGPPRPWLRSLRPPPIHLEGPQRGAFAGHADGIETVDVSWDGKRLASAGGNTDRDTAIRVWDLERGALLCTLRGHERLVHRVRFARDGSRLVSASADGTIRIWDVERAEQQQCLSGHGGNVDCVALSPGGDRLVSGSRDGTVRLWQLNPAGPPRLLSAGVSQARGVAFHPREPVVAAGFVDHAIRLWHADTGAELRTLRGHEGLVYAVAFSPDGTLLASGSRDRTVRVWEVATGRELWRKPCAHGHWVYSVAFSPDGKLLASGSRDQTVRLWDVAGGEQLLCLRGHQGAVYSVAFRRPDGAELVSGSGDSMVRVWRTAAAPQRELDDHVAPIRCLAFAPDGSCLVTGSGHVYLPDHTVRVWDAATGLRRLPPLQGHTDNVLCMAVSRGGRLVASGGRDRTLRLWDGRSGAPLACLDHPLRVESVALTPDGTRLASGCLDRLIRVWDLEGDGGQPRPPRELAGHKLLVSCLAFHPDGVRLASGSPDGTVRLWDQGTGEGACLGTDLGRVRDVAFSPEGRQVVAGTRERTVYVWSTDTGMLQATCHGCDDVRAVAGGFAYRGRVEATDNETVIEAIGAGPVARFPTALQGLIPHPDPRRRVWAGAAGNHLCLLELREG